MIEYHRIAQQFYNQPLLLLPASAETISNYLLSRIAAGPRGQVAENDAGRSVQAFRGRENADGSAEIHAPRASRFYGEYPLGEDGRPQPYRRTAEGVGIITMVGEFVNRGAWVGAYSGLISYEGVRYQLQRAAADAKTRVILLDMESPGGQAVGAFETAGLVREVARQKPVVAVVNGLAASAGYAIASAATRIVTLPTGLSGSIGTVMLHLDYSKYLEQEGIKPTLIFAGAHKVDGNPYEPLPEEVRADFQRQIESFNAQFVALVAAGRTSLSEDRVRATEARIYKGQEAIDAGLADDVGTFEDVLADLSRGSGRFLQSKGVSMSTQNEGAPAADNAGISDVKSTAFANATELAAAYPELAAQLRQEGAACERARIAGIQQHAMPGHEHLIAEMIADGRTTPDQAAARILAAEKAARQKQMQSIADVESAVAGKLTPSASAMGATERPQAVAQTPEGWAAEYERSEELQAEFASAATYVAFKRAEASGQARMLRQRA